MLYFRLVWGFRGKHWRLGGNIRHRTARCDLSSRQSSKTSTIYRDGRTSRGVFSRHSSRRLNSTRRCKKRRMLETGPWPRRTFDAELGQVLAVGHLERRRADSAAIAGLLAHGASQQGRDEAPEEEVRRCYRWRYVSHGLPCCPFSACERGRRGRCGAASASLLRPASRFPLPASGSMSAPRGTSKATIEREREENFF